MSNLVFVEKDGKRIGVHPNGLEEHRKLGWSVSADQSVPQLDLAATEAAKSDSDTGESGSATLTREAIAEMDKAALTKALEEHGADVDGRFGVEKLRETLIALLFPVSE